MPWSQTERPVVARDADGTERASVRYRVWDASTEQLLTDPTQILQSDTNPVGLPPYNSTLPGSSTLRLDRYDVSADKPIFDVTAYYSNDRRFIFPTQQNAQPDLTLWSGSFEQVTFDVPFARLVTQAITDPLNGESVEVYSWDFASQPVSETRLKFGRNVINETNLAIGLQAIEDNNNKLQLIGGKWYLFKAGNFRQPTPVTWEVTYSFILDRGTKSYRIADPDLSAQGIFLPPSNSKFPELFGQEEWIRPPYCNLIIKQRATSAVPAGEISILDFIPVCAYDISANGGLGWQTLPGLNL